jgi:hypothetical protein
MNTYTIKTHRPRNKISKPHFFILNKGINSGKPLEMPCPNCFVCSTETQDEKDLYYRLIYALWQSKAFQPFLRGSVIPFIQLNELKACIQKAVDHANKNPESFCETMEALKKLEEKEKFHSESLRLIRQAKLLIFKKFLRLE